MSVLHVSAGVLIAVTAVTHSILGERHMIGPLLASGALAALPRVARAIRFTWHLATLLMLLTALTVASTGTPPVVARVIGGAYLLLGLLSLAMTRGGHVSGPLFTVSGLLAVIA